MIPILVTLAALSVFGPPHLKHKPKAPCPADTVYITKSYYWQNHYYLLVSDTLRVKGTHPHR